MFSLKVLNYFKLEKASLDRHLEDLRAKISVIWTGYSYSLDIWKVILFLISVTGK